MWHWDHWFMCILYHKYIIHKLYSSNPLTQSSLECQFHFLLSGIHIIHCTICTWDWKITSCHQEFLVKRVFVFVNGSGGISKILRGTGMKDLGFKGVTPLKTRQFWPICLLSLNNFATCLDFFLFFSWFFHPQNFRRMSPSLKILGGMSPPLFPPLLLLVLVNELPLYIVPFVLTQCGSCFERSGHTCILCQD